MVLLECHTNGAERRLAQAEGHARFAADLPNRLGTTGALGRRTAMKRPTPESVSVTPRHTETENCTRRHGDLHRQGCLHGLRRRIRRDGGTQLHCRKSRGAVFEVCCNLYRKGGLLQVLRSLRSELRGHGG